MKTPAKRLQDLRDRIDHLLDTVLKTGQIGDHLDNTGMRCRVDLASHDCCYTCNLIGELLDLGALHGIGRDS